MLYIYIANQKTLLGLVGPISGPDPWPNLYYNCFGIDDEIGYFKMAVKNCSMMSTWHHAVSGSVHPKVPETTKASYFILLATGLVYVFDKMTYSSRMT